VLSPIALPWLLLLADVDGPAALPEALPPLDPGLVDDVDSGPRFFAHARMRAELDDSRDLSRIDDTAAGAALSGRVGVDADVQRARVIVVVGDGGRIGVPSASGSAAPPLLARPALPQLLEATLAFDTEVAGFPATFLVGRAPVVVADGRLVGTEPYDARGRTLDGVALRGGTDAVRAGVGAYWLDPFAAAATGEEAAWSGLALAHVAARGVADETALDAYALLHRDGALGLTVPTIGARTTGALLSFVRGRAGADVQAVSIDAEGPWSTAGSAMHLEIGARALAPLSTTISPRVPDVFLDAALELTSGDVVHGRSFRAPAPTQHGTLGLLDLVAMDNTWSAAVTAGVLDGSGLLIDVAARMVGIVDPADPLVDTAGAPLPMRVGAGIALLELDARFEVPLGAALFLDVGYGVALPGHALIGDQPAQRLLVALSGTTDTGDDTPLLPLRAARR
jgi:hypothetical protein